MLEFLTDLLATSPKCSPVLPVHPDNVFTIPWIVAKLLLHIARVHHPTVSLYTSIILCKVKWQEYTGEAEAL